MLGNRPSPTTVSGRVLPATALARADAVQRIAGIQYPVTGSVRVLSKLSPWVDRSSERQPLMMDFDGSTSCKLSRPQRFDCSARRIAKRGPPVRCIALERKNLLSARPIRRSPGNPHECWTSHSILTINAQINLTVNLCQELSATFRPSDLSSD